MKPIKIRVRRKTLVPTKYQANHKYRSDWKLAGVIDYNDSFDVFKSVNGGGVCENEAQFAKLMYDNYGAGTYSCIAWIRNRGDGRFFGFWKGELTNDGFRRLPKNVTNEMKERKDNTTQLKKLKKKLNSEDVTADDRIDIQSEIDELQEELGVNDEIIELESDNRSGPSGYLKCATPVYRTHAYENYGNSANTTEVGEVDFY